MPQQLIGFENIKGIHTIPGTKKIEYASLEDIDLASTVESITSDTYRQQLPIIFKPGKSWHTMPLVFDKNAYNRSQRKDTQGILHSFSLSGLLPYHNDMITAELDRLAHHELITKITDREDMEHIFGTIRTPVQFSSSSIMNNNSRQHSCTFTGTQRRIPPQYLIVG